MVWNSLWIRFFTNLSACLLRWFFFCKNRVLAKTSSIVQTRMMPLLEIYFLTDLKYDSIVGVLLWTASTLSRGYSCYGNWPRSCPKKYNMWPSSWKSLPGVFLSRASPGLMLSSAVVVVFRFVKLPLFTALWLAFWELGEEFLESNSWRSTLLFSWPIRFCRGDSGDLLPAI